jgi:hypothetical protein
MAVHPALDEEYRAEEEEDEAEVEDTEEADCSEPRGQPLRVTPRG